jgi:hypothetical protein
MWRMWRMWRTPPHRRQPSRQCARPRIAIASFVVSRGGASSHEILEHFFMDGTTLRRQPALRRLGVAFVENGSGEAHHHAAMVLSPRREPATGELQL